jgi:protein-L-isoaspartate(D-aspartate) O-methyltransferase
VFIVKKHKLILKGYSVLLPPMIAMQQNDTYRHKGLRKELVKQLAVNPKYFNRETNKWEPREPIADKEVLNAIEAVPRHFFFGNDSIFFESHAYQDKPFQIGEEQTISQPYTVARQSELLQVKPKDKVLEIGTGSGYQAAVLHNLGARVYTIERQRKLFDKTKPLMESLGYHNVRCYFGDGFEGLPMFAPFNKVIITAAVPELPKKLLHQLAIGGQMVLPFGTETNCIMLRITKGGEDQYSTEEFGRFAFVPMLKGKVF